MCRFSNNLHIFFCMMYSLLRDCGELLQLKRCVRISVRVTLAVRGRQACLVAGLD